MTRPHVMNAQQALEWCDKELADFARRRHAHELDYATDQLHKAKATGDDERRWYWAGVHQRLTQGERLSDAMSKEHDARRGPLTVRFHNGFRQTIGDLDYWKVT